HYGCQSLNCHYTILFCAYYEKDFPYTIACVNFISELREKNIIVEFDSIFIDTVLDRIYRETTNYLVR
ncbi:MAG: hypothetical protein RR623_06670, partial [Bacilli bacterium]